MQTRIIEIGVGLFMIAGLLALLALAFQVSGLTTYGRGDTYTIRANFDNVGDLKVRAPVSVSGVTIGRVTSILLDPVTFRAKVIMQIDKKYNRLPIDTSASIFTQGILGSNYISLTPGFETSNLKAGGTLETTHSALILENLIGQLIYSVKGSENNKKK